MTNDQPVPALAWLASRAALDDDARRAAGASLGAGADDPALVVQAMLAADRPADALRVVASALPPREGIWWALLAAQHATQQLAARADADPTQPRPTALRGAALAATERWVAQPTDEHRRAAWDASQAAGMDTPAGSVAAAVYFTGGSITPPDGPFVPPPAGIHVIMAATAVLLASVETDVERLRDVAGAFAQQGMELVRRLGGWDTAIALARQAHDAQLHLHAEASKPPVLPGAEA